ncbi:MAG: hypothetical protein P1U81_14250 [Verrucomicrobiales bacterium]|jgi:hypothetical protein|nr:hypothetical protein [Verrucomicrobiales bacterium]
MKNLTYICSLLLVGLGAFGYFGYEILGAAKQSITALIPAFIGAPMLVGALIANKSVKVGIHIAVLFSFLGALAGLGRIIPGSIKGSLDWGKPSTLFILAMTLICLCYTVMAVRSFIAARKARG